MENPAYKKQVTLLLRVLPEVAKEFCFALYGGTAINLFVRDMPRLSVDIDLTYIPIEDRETSLRNISDALDRIRTSIEATISNVIIQHQGEVSKLQISSPEAQIKLEVNQVTRGLITTPRKMQLCMKAQTDYDAFCSIQVVSLGQLYGGKICAALDRQHPRDLFDIKYLLEEGGITPEIKTGFLLCLLSSDRPIHEIIKPNFQDQRQVLENQFAGMTRELFTYDEFESVRETLVEKVNTILTKKDKQFLIGFKNVTPDWSIHDFERFPAIQWKLQNLQKLKTINPVKHQLLLKNLAEKLGE